MTLKDIKHWVFDMDGTLTLAVHDFAAPPRQTSTAQNIPPAPARA